MTTTLVIAALMNVTLWRGETAGYRLNEAVRAEGPVPAGLSVRVGTLKEAKYEVRPEGRVLGTCYDRIDFGQGSGGEGVKFAEFKAARDMKPGTYEVGDVSVTVLERTLPEPAKWDYYLDLWQHPWAFARASNTVPFHYTHDNYMRPIYKMLARCGLKSITVTLVDQPWNHQCYDAYGTMVRHIRKADGTWTFDYKVFDRFVAFAKTQGLGPDIACYTLCPWGLVLRWEDEQGGQHAERAEIGSDLFKDYWGPFLKDFAKHLKEKGWFQDAIIAMDERSPEQMRIIADFVRANAPGLRVQLAGNRPPSDFDGIDIDVYAQYLGDVTPKFLEDAAKRRAQGKKTLFYVCCSPDRPNTFVDSDPDEAFWIGFAPAPMGLDGFLRWALNSWPADPAKNVAYGNWRSGDTFLIYPDGSWSWRFYDLMAGVQAAVKYRELEKDPARKEDLRKIASHFDAQAVRNAIAGKTHFPYRRQQIEAVLNAR